MTTREYRAAKEKAEQYRLDRLQKEELRKIKYGERKKIQTSKIFFMLVFLTCTAVIIYSMYAMLKMMDLSALPVLISSTVTEGIVLAGYFAKSYLETKSEKDLEFEKEKFYHSNEEAVG